MFVFPVVGCLGLLLIDRFGKYNVSPMKNAASRSSSRTSAHQQPSELVSVVGFGSLMSERSSRLTFPDLQNFRRVRVENYRRVFGHVASIFLQRGIGNLDTMELSSLSVEPCDGAGFAAVAFEVPNTLMMADGVPSPEFLEREEEFDIRTVPFHEENGQVCRGILCTRASDDAYIQRWGRERFDEHYTKYGITTIWNWNESSTLRPCAVYLRHCVLAAKGANIEDSFLDDTFLVDRKTTIRTYLQQNPQIMSTNPPPELAERYGG